MSICALWPLPHPIVSDWTFGDDQPGSIYEKPVAWFNVSPRGAGGAHEELRTVLRYAHADIVGEACLDVPITPAMIDESGMLTDPLARAHIAGALSVLAQYVRGQHQHHTNADTTPTPTPITATAECLTVRRRRGDDEGGEFRAVPPMAFPSQAKSRRQKGIDVLGSPFRRHTRRCCWGAIIGV